MFDWYFDKYSKYSIFSWFFQTGRQTDMGDSLFNYSCSFCKSNPNSIHQSCRERKLYNIDKLLDSKQYHLQLRISCSYQC